MTTRNNENQLPYHFATTERVRELLYVTPKRLPSQFTPGTPLVQVAALSSSSNRFQFQMDSTTGKITINSLSPILHNASSSTTMITALPSSPRKSISENNNNNNNNNNNSNNNNNYNPEVIQEMAKLRQDNDTLKKQVSDLTLKLGQIFDFMTKGREIAPNTATIISTNTSSSSSSSSSLNRVPHVVASKPIHTQVAPTHLTPTTNKSTMTVPQITTTPPR